MTTYYRTPRGGNCPLDERQRRELLALYGNFGLTVMEIADSYGVGTSTVYRWLALLGVRPQHEMAEAERERMHDAQRRARKARRKKSTPTKGAR